MREMFTRLHNVRVLDLSASAVCLHALCAASLLAPLRHLATLVMDDVTVGDGPLDSDADSLRAVVAAASQTLRHLSVSQTGPAPRRWAWTERERVAFVRAAANAPRLERLEVRGAAGAMGLRDEHLDVVESRGVEVVL